MAKKAPKGKPAKKAVKPAKKVVAKKATPKKALAKNKPTAKPVKKATPKKIVKKAAAKPIKKVAPAKKKATPKKIVKPLKKVAPKKAAASKVVKQVKKAIAKKPAKPVKPVKKSAAKPAKKVVKPVKKTVVKPVAKKPEVKKLEAKKSIVPAKKLVIAKKTIPSKPIASPSKQTPVVAKKKQEETSWDDDDDKKTAYKDEPMVVEYKTPTVAKPLGPTPTPHINTDSRTRYSDQELKEFKELILKKLDEATKDLELLRNTLSHKDDHGTDDTSPTFKLLEDGSDVLSKEETSHLANRQEKFIQNLQNALIRIENKTYGICRVTGKLISKERLKSVPHATLAIEAKLGQHN